MVYKNVRLYVCRRLYLFPFGNIMLKTSIIGKSHYLSPGWRGGYDCGDISWLTVVKNILPIAGHNSISDPFLIFNLKKGMQYTPLY